VRVGPFLSHRRRCHPGTVPAGRFPGQRRGSVRAGRNRCRGPGVDRDRDAERFPRLAGHDRPAVSGCAGRPDHPPQPGSEGGQTLSLCPVPAVTPSPRASVRSTSWNRAPGPSQPPTPRPGPTTPSPTIPRSRSSAAPASAGSSTNTGEQHKSPGQVRKPSSGTLQDEQVAGGKPDHVWQAGERQRAAVGPCGGRCGDHQPGRDVGQRAGLAGPGDQARLRRRCLRVNVAVPGVARLGPGAARPALVWVG
jgi:hypothetical protein